MKFLSILVKRYGKLDNDLFLWCAIVHEIYKFFTGEKWLYSELFWSVFSRIRIQYGEMVRISQYSVQLREITDQKNSKYGYFYTVLLKYFV